MKTSVNTSNRKIKRVAKIYSASLILNAMGTGAYSAYLTENDHELLHIEMLKISQRLNDDTCGSLDEIVLLVKNHKS